MNELAGVLCVACGVATATHGPQSLSRPRKRLLGMFEKYTSGVPFDVCTIGQPLVHLLNGRFSTVLLPYSRYNNFNGGAMLPD